MGKSGQFYPPSKKDKFVKKDKKEYVSEVDVEYPKERQKDHNDLSF